MLKKANELSDDKVMEISCIYDLTKFFEYQRNREEELEELKKATNEKERNYYKKRVDDIDRRAIEFVRRFKENPTKYWVGKGFVTFKNFKYAKLFKSIYNKAYRGTDQQYLNERAGENIGKLRSKVFSQMIKPKLKLKEAKNLISKTDNFPLKEEEKPKTEESEKPKRNKSFSKMADVADYIKFGKNTNTDVKKQKLMREHFGPDFTLKRGTDTKYLNFDFKGTKKIKSLEFYLYVLLFFFLMPSFAYYFNFKYFECFIDNKRYPKEGYYELLVQNGYVIMTVVIDNIALALISACFHKKRFFKVHTMYKYTIFFSCLFILLSDIVMPNLAMKEAFERVSGDLSLLEKKELVAFLIKSLYFNFYIVIISGINFKIIGPYVINKYILKKTSKMNQNSNIIFGLSFLTNCVFNTAFYGSLTPVVFLMFLVFVFGIIVLDYFTFAQENRKLKKKPKKNTTDKYIRVGSNLDLPAPIIRKENPNSKLEKEVKSLFDIKKTRKEKNERLPITIFVNAALCLIVGIFFLSSLGFHGVAKDFEFLLSMKEHGTPALFWQYFSTFRHKLVSIGRFINGHVNPLPTFTQEAFGLAISGFYNIIKETLLTLITDPVFFIYCALYLITLSLFFIFYNNERFLNRVQSRVWKKQKKIENVFFSGRSYREVNPAYKLMDFNLDK